MAKGPLTDQRKKILARVTQNWYDSTNPWKYADGYFDKAKFKSKIVSLIRKINY